MSMLHAATPYRRDDRASLRVPVVMPMVEVKVGDDGCLDVALDHEPYSADGALHREDLHRMLGDIASDLDTPLRVEVHEANGTSFTDIITPAPARLRRSEPVGIAATKVGEVAGSGFVPNEDVAIAVVVAHQVADVDGTARLRLPPALLAAHPGLVVLMGRTSGTVMVSDGVA